MFFEVELIEFAHFLCEYLTVPELILQDHSCFLYPTPFHCIPENFGSNGEAINKNKTENACYQ